MVGAGAGGGAGRGAGAAEGAAVFESAARCASSLVIFPPGPRPSILEGSSWFSSTIRRTEGRRSSALDGATGVCFFSDVFSVTVDFVSRGEAAGLSDD